MAKVIVLYSGGKDSQAALIWACKKFGAKKVEAVFCDTGWEHELTYKHVQETTAQLGVKLVTLKSKIYNGMVDLAVKKKRFPSTKSRFCTEELKTKPAIDYVLSHKKHFLIIQGIRNDESADRAKMLENCRYFKFYFEPYRIGGKYDSILAEDIEVLKAAYLQGLGGKTMIRKIMQVERIYNLNPCQQNYLHDLNEINELPKNRVYFYHTYRKKEVFEWCKEYDDSVLRPVIKWTAEEVINYIFENGQKPNPLYYIGSKRVGCYPCIMSSQDELKSIAEFSPEYIERVFQAEITAQSSFFKPDYIPKRYCSQTAKNGKKYPTAIDVLNYITREKTGNLFAEIEGERSCMSYYNICER